MWPNAKLDNRILTDDIAGEVRKRGIQKRQTRRITRPKGTTVHRYDQRRGGVRK